MAELTISIIGPSWSRDMSVKTWSKGTENALILITSPVRNKGKVFLKRKKDIWNWIPSIDRNIKLPPSMMMQWWMGSDFTNDDLIKESSLRIKRSLGLQRGKVTSGSPGTNSNLPVFSRHVV
ncbi:outer membrane lipoprotein-sorting protein [Catalinimonas sp. 4WD22]|uniref:outer membrane lipoprotein-sorting protein n=1 Tax=Catalinimonas locisalis TaxID=3133978 RepID=UPI0031011734